ncbi:MAG TPA: GNAT family N-acetyltransferase [Acidimicrobiales bacterium]|nr:GNAT family N-acetyltransferase [Acidimicrobiales bacterium]
MPVTIGSVSPAHFPAILTFWVEAATVPSSTDDLEGLLALYVRDPDCVIVATEDDAIVGTLIVGWDGWRGAFYRLAVHPSHRRAGLGRALVVEGEARLARLGVRRINLFAVGTHGPAVAFWKALGYQCDPGHLRFARNLMRAPDPRT